MRRFYILFSFLALYSITLAQDSPLKDEIYNENVRSVQFHVKGLPLTYPIVELATGGQLELNFDDIAGNDNYYFYTFVHCDRNWMPTKELEKFEYIDGYEREEIRDYEFSYGTDIDYTHYSLTIPNDDMGWKLSGNYLLIITDDNKDLVMTRRFMVVESSVRISAELVRPAVASNFKTHQEIDFTINTLNNRVVNPDQEITAVVMQNGRWSNAIKDLKHRFIVGDELKFNYQDKIVFPAMKEFRHIDITSLTFRSLNVLKINNFANMTEVIMEKSRPRKYSSFYSDIDINGKFVIKTDDRRQGFSTETESVTFDKQSLFNYGNLNLSEEQRDEIRQTQTNSFQNTTKDHLESEYAEVIVSLIVDQPYAQELFAVGAMSDWKLDPKFQMHWNDKLGGYIGKFLLKQGFYDYQFALADENNQPDFSSVEGDWYEAFNDYTILCYFKPFAGRYEMLVGAYTFDTDVQIRY